MAETEEPIEVQYIDYIAEENPYRLMYILEDEILMMDNTPAPEWINETYGDAIMQELTILVLDD